MTTTAAGGDEAARPALAQRVGGLDRTADLSDADVQVPPTPPTMSTVWNIAEVRRLPMGSVVIWCDGEVFGGDRRAGVLNDWGGEVSIQHTDTNNYYIDDLEMIEFPALALTWPDSVPSDSQGNASPGNLGSPEISNTGR